MGVSKSRAISESVSPGPHRVVEEAALGRADLGSFTRIAFGVDRLPRYHKSITCANGVGVGDVVGLEQVGQRHAERASDLAETVARLDHVFL